MRNAAQPQAIRVNVSALERLRREIMAGFSSPEGRREAGGLLLGSRTPGGDQVTIEAIHPLPCDYALGPTYALDEAGTARMREAIRQLGSDPELKLTVLGIYRGHIRPDIYADFRDLSLLQACFGDTGAICLLLKPSVSRPLVGALFYCEEGRLERHPHNIEFPREGAGMPGSETRPQHPPHGAPVPNPVHPSFVPPQPVQQSVPVSTPPAPTISLSTGTVPRFDFINDETEQEAESSLPQVRRLNAWLVVAVLAGLVVLATVYLVWQKSRAQLPGVQTTATGVKPSQAGFGLNVERVGNDLRVSWNRLDSNVVRAQAAMLIIHDGSNPRQDVLLDGNQLRNGSVLYSPVSGYVQFRLELLGSEAQGASESVLAISGRQSVPAEIPVSPQPVTRSQNATPANLTPAPPPVAHNAVRQAPPGLPPVAATQHPAAATQPVASKPQPAARAPVKPIETASTTSASAPTTPGEPATQPRPAQPAASQPKRIFVPPASSPGNQQVRVVVVEPPAVPQNNSQPGVPITLAQRIDLPSAPPPAPVRAAEPPPPAASEPKPQYTAPKPQPAAPKLEAAAPKLEAASRSNVLAPSEPITVPPAVPERPASVAYVPPRPINQAQPTLPREISKMLYGEATVDVRVKIDATGRVAGVEAVSKPGPLRPFLERAALDAARLWRFSPAMMGDRPVAGETVVQFTFRSAQGIR